MTASAEIPGKEIRLGKAASWASERERAANPLLGPENAERNGGQTRRYALVAGRRFVAVRESRRSGWFVTEVFPDGQDIWVFPDGTESPYARARGVDAELKVGEWCVRLRGRFSVASAIAEAVSR